MKTALDGDAEALGCEFPGLLAPLVILDSQKTEDNAKPLNRNRPPDNDGLGRLESRAASPENPGIEDLQLDELSPT